MSTQKNLKRYIFFRVSILALCMSLLLAYQGTQSFLRGIDLSQKKAMTVAADFFPTGKTGGAEVFRYHVASSWEYVPESIKSIFPEPPEQAGELLTYRHNWWYFAPPEEAYDLILVPSESGETRYVSSYKNYSSSELAAPGISPRLKDPMVQMALAAIATLTIFWILLYCTFRSLTKPAEVFYRWAAHLDLKTVKEPTPNFNYEELNTLATIMHRSMENMGKALEREEEFLAYASHELRTPITALRGNTTLLDRISPHPPEKEREVRDRILRSSLSMKGITETLLWLSRENEEPLPNTSVDIPSTLNKTVDELNYLLEGKQVSLSINTTPCIKELPEGAFLILVTNLIRNAFQHTGSGLVEIKQTGSTIQIKNSVQQTHGIESTGFGLGLKLVRKVSDSFGWKLTVKQSDGFHDVVVKLPFQGS